MVNNRVLVENPVLVVGSFQVELVLVALDCMKADGVGEGRLLSVELGHLVI